MDKLLLSNGRYSSFLQRRGYLPSVVSQVSRKLQQASSKGSGVDRCTQTFRPRSHPARKPILLSSIGCENCARRQLSTLKGTYMVRTV